MQWLTTLCSTWEGQGNLNIKISSYSKVFALLSVHVFTVFAGGAIHV